MTRLDVTGVRVNIHMPEGMQEPGQEPVQEAAAETAQAKSTSTSADAQSVTEAATVTDADTEKEGEAEAGAEAEAEAEVVVRTHPVLASVDNSPYYARPVEIELKPSLITVYLPAPSPPAEQQHVISHAQEGSDLQSSKAFSRGMAQLKQWVMERMA